MSALGDLGLSLNRPARDDLSVYMGLDLAHAAVYGELDALDVGG